MRLIWHKLEDVGHPNADIGLVWIKAHRTAKDKLNMTASHKKHTMGNEAVDLYAKAGAEEDRGFGKELVIHEAAAKVSGALDYIVEAQGHAGSSL